jgi:IMP dehydrogenase
MAISLAINGGLGILHRYNTISQQVEMVSKVKRYLSFIITEPYTIRHTDTLNNMLEKISRYNVYSYIVTDDDNKLLGIVTKRDLNLFSGNYDTLISNIMSRDLITVTDTITRDTALEIMNKYKIEKLPVINDKNEPTGIITYKNLIEYKKNHDRYSLDTKGRLLVGAAVGIVGDYLERARALVDAGCDIICIDVANGYNTRLEDVIAEIKALNVEIMAGNVCNEDGFEYLALCGADCIRVGIGSGSICSTRLVTGVGCGQFSALLRCRDIARKYNVGMISDGGHLGKDGNIAKAFVAGADAMMLGKTFAATDETPGNILFRNGKRVKCYRGMASTMAMISKAENTHKEYVQTQAPEGFDIEVEIKGPVGDIIKRIESSIKSTMSYIGCVDVYTLRHIEGEIIYNRQSIGVMSETSIRK